MVKIDGVECGPVGYGLMSFTWTENPIPFEDAIKLLKEAVNKRVLFWNGGEFYGPPTRNSLHLLRKYFDAHPEDKDKVRFNIKGSFSMTNGKPDPTPAGIERSIKACQEILGDVQLDMFEPARLDREIGIDETLHALKKAYDNGQIRGVGLTEVSGQTIQRAHEILGDALKTVELELSLCNVDFLEDDALKTCAKHNIPLVAYSPLGRGLLSGRFLTPSDVPKRMQDHFPRFSGDNLVNNLRLAHAVIDMAKEKSVESGSTVTPAQVALGWLMSVSGQNGNPSIMPIPSATTLKRMEENFSPVPLTEADLSKLRKITDDNVMAGPRYLDNHAKYLVV